MEEVHGRPENNPPSNETLETSVSFTLDELWLLHQRVRHAGDANIEYPPFSFDLNRDIGFALLVAVDSYDKEATLSLDLAKILVIDYNILAGTKGRGGNPDGDTILLKIFAARRDLEYKKLGLDSDENEESPPTNKEDITKRLSESGILGVEENNYANNNDTCDDSNSDSTG